MEPYLESGCSYLSPRREKPPKTSPVVDASAKRATVTCSHTPEMRLGVKVDCAADA